MSARIPIPPPLDGQPFTAGDAIANGLSRTRLRGVDLHSPFHGIRTSAPPRDTLEAASAYLPKMIEGRAFGGWTAAAIHGLPLPHGDPAAPSVTVAVAKGKPRPTGRGVVSRQVLCDVFDSCTIDGVPVTPPALTWCLLAGECSVADLVRLGDAIVSDNASYYGRRAGFTPVTLAELADAVEKWSGCTGVEKLRLALPLVREHVASPPETDMRLAVIDAGLPEFEINVPITLPSGREVIVDGLLRDLKVVFEYEGDGHRGRDQFRKDINRYAELQALDYIPVRATADLYRDRAGFQRRARDAYEKALRRRPI